MSEFRQVEGGWSRPPPPDCENCSLAWPFDGTIGRVRVRYFDGWMIYECAGCGHETRVAPPATPGGTG